MDVSADDGATLVETGSLRVDRGRALDKIRAYRRGDVGCVWLFLRAACAAGADDAAVRRRPDGLVIEFGGRPFAERDLRDPYAPLFEGESSEAHRWLALGLLHAIGPGLRLISVESGGKDARRRLSAREVGGEVVAEVPCEGMMTVVRLKTEWGPERHWRHPLPVSAQEAAPRGLVWGRMRTDVECGYESFSSRPPRPPGPQEWDWTEGAATGRLQLPERGGQGLDFFVAGVYAGTHPLGGPVPVVGKVEDPGLALDASLASIARNERFEAVLESARRNVGLLTEKVARGQAEARAELEPLVAANDVLRRFWTRSLEGFPDAERAAEDYFAGAGAPPPGSRAEAIRLVRRAARAERWLKRAGAL